MLSSIHPFGERARRQRFGVTATFFAVGSVLGGGILGGVLALGSAAFAVFGPMPRAAMLILVVSAVWDIFRLPVPSLARQVDENWLPRYRGWVYGLGFGVQLGVGFATYVKTALTYGFVAAALLAGSPPVALAAGLGFGLVRGLSLLVTARVHSPDQLRAVFDRLTDHLAPVRLASAVGIALIATLGLVL